MKNRIVFWQNIPSIHQAPFLREVALQFPGDVIVVTERDVSTERLAMGWSRPEFRPASLVVEPPATLLEKIINYEPESTVHIFSGFHAYPKTYQVMKQVAKLKTGLGVFAEPGRPDGIKGRLRKIRYMMLATRWRKRIDFLLATGRLGVNWYTQSGFPGEKVFPFAYFVENGHEVSDEPKISSDDIFRFVYVGQLTHGKGLDLLFRALSRIDLQQWELTIIGTGAERSKLEEMSDILGISRNLNWQGALPNLEVRQKIAKSDCLVLPSRYDGWGAVVNEALLAGTRVIVSDACGSSDLINSDFLGKVFRSEDIESLFEALNILIDEKDYGRKGKDEIRKWSARAISPRVGAEYFLRIVKHTYEKKGKAEPPWR